MEMNADEFRAAALRVPGAAEAAHMNHPDFRVNGKIFASLGYPDECRGMVKLTPDQQRSFMKKSPGAFKPCSGAWGARGATNVHLASVSPGTLSEALEAAYQNVISPVKSKSRLKRPTKAIPVGRSTITRRATTKHKTKQEQS
jgi:hypothetical protein